MGYHASNPGWESTYRRWFPLRSEGGGHPVRPKSPETIERERVEATVLAWVCSLCNVSHPASWGGCAG